MSRQLPHYEDEDLKLMLQYFMRRGMSVQAISKMLKASFHRVDIYINGEQDFLTPTAKRRIGREFTQMAFEEKINELRFKGMKK
jgi:hypothetical protein